MGAYIEYTTNYQYLINKNKPDRPKGQDRKATRKQKTISFRAGGRA